MQEAAASHTIHPGVCLLLKPQVVRYETCNKQLPYLLLCQPLYNGILHLRLLITRRVRQKAVGAGVGEYGPVCEDWVGIRLAD